MRHYANCIDSLETALYLTFKLNFFPPRSCSNVVHGITGYRERKKIFIDLHTKKEDKKERYNETQEIK